MTKMGPWLVSSAGWKVCGEVLPTAPNRALGPHLAWRMLHKAPGEVVYLEHRQRLDMGPEEVGRWLFAIAKHLKSYGHDSRMAALYAIRRSAADGELLLRLRGLRFVGAQKLQALALDVGIPRQELPATLRRLTSTGLVETDTTAPGNQIQGVRESIFTEGEVFRAMSDLFEDADPQPFERIMPGLLDLMSRLPLTEAEAIQRMCSEGCAEEEVRKALEFQEAYGLVKRQAVSDFGLVLLYNEYLWSHKIDRIGPVLARLGPSEKDYLLALMEEVRSAQGLTLTHLTAAPRHIIALAAKTGIIDTTTILTSMGDEQTFAFSPQFYGYRAGMQPIRLADDSDHVKLFVASISYGVHHSVDFRLHSPLLFVRKLLDEGEAGGSTPILRDYPLLEKHGIVTVEERTQGRGTFVLQKRDIVEQAVDVLQSGAMLHESGADDSARSLISQTGFRTPEENRLTAPFSRRAGGTSSFDHDLLAAVREVAQGGNW